jgi:AraC-like DNA-binding protein
MAHAALPLASYREFASDSFEAMHARLSLALKPHRLRRLSNVPVAGIICRTTLRQVSLNVLRIGPSVEVTPGALDDFFLVQVPIVGTVELSVGNERIRCEQSTAAVVSPGEPLHLKWSDHCTQLIVQIPRAAMNACVARRVGFKSRTALRFQTAFDLDSRGGRDWRDLLELVIRAVDRGGAFACDPIRGELEDLLLAGLLAVQPHNHAGDLLPGDRPAPFYVVRAERAMRRQLGEPLTLADLAAAAGVSERTLHYGFRNFRGTTPMGRLAALRLQQGRRLLQNAAQGSTVSRIAAEVGFAQLGRFAGIYREAFGELPSQTLRTARASAPSERLS